MFIYSYNKVLSLKRAKLQAANDAFLRYERICKAKSLDGSTSTFDLIYENGQGQEQLLNELTVVTKKCTELQIENARLKNLELIEGAPSSLLKKECMTLKSQVSLFPTFFIAKHNVQPLMYCK